MKCVCVSVWRTPYRKREAKRKRYMHRWKTDSIDANRRWFFVIVSISIQTKKNIYFDFNVCSNEYKLVKVQESNRIVYTSTITRRFFCRCGRLYINLSEIFIWNQFSRLDFLLFFDAGAARMKNCICDQSPIWCPKFINCCEDIVCLVPVAFHMRTRLHDPGVRVERWDTNRVWV